MDGKPEDPIEVGSRVLVNEEVTELALVDPIRMAIHEVVDSILNRVEAINLESIRIKVEKVEGFEDFDIDHNVHRDVPPQYRVEARGLTQYKHLKEPRTYAIQWQNTPVEKDNDE